MASPWPGPGPVPGLLGAYADQAPPSEGHPARSSPSLPGQRPSDLQAPAGLFQRRPAPRPGWLSPLLLPLRMAPLPSGLSLGFPGRHRGLADPRPESDALGSWEELPWLWAGPLPWLWVSSQAASPPGAGCSRLPSPDRLQLPPVWASCRHLPGPLFWFFLFLLPHGEAGSEL